MFYVETYRLYPVYEPAEGGYHYECTECLWSDGFRTLKEALRHLELEALELGFIKRSDDFYHDDAFLNKYIGDGEFITITTTKYAHVCEPHPYC